MARLRGVLLYAVATTAVAAMLVAAQGRPAERHAGHAGHAGSTGLPARPGLRVAAPGPRVAAASVPAGHEPPPPGSGRRWA